MTRPTLLPELILDCATGRTNINPSSAADQTERFFVEDLGANGLRASRRPGPPFDIT